VVLSEVDKLAQHIKDSAAGAKNNQLWHYFSLSSRAQLEKGKVGEQDKFEYLTLQVDALSRKLDSHGGVTARTLEMGWVGEVLRRIASQFDIPVIGFKVDPTGFLDVDVSEEIPSVAAKPNYIKFVQVVSRETSLKVRIFYPTKSVHRVKALDQPIIDAEDG
jgi:hypothetical protein